jgi:DNA-binding winged helix-turn-helix (wHTH) protein
MNQGFISTFLLMLVSFPAQNAGTVPAIKAAGDQVEDTLSLAFARSNSRNSPFFLPQISLCICLKAVTKTRIRDKCGPTEGEMGSRGQILRFGPFEFQVGEGELRRNGIRIFLEDHPRRILELLLDEPGALVSRERIRESLWGEAVFVDHEHGIHKAVNKLRTALGENGRDRLFIETRSRRGYRFVAAVKRLPVDGTIHFTQRASASLQPQPSTGTNGAEMDQLIPQSNAVTAESAGRQSGHRKGFAIGLSAGLGLSLLTIFAGFGPRSGFGHRNTQTSRPATVVNAVLLLKSGALDPVDEGFKVFAFGEFQGHVMRNAAMNGFDRWKTTSNDQGYYYRTLTDAEKDFALRDDWTLTCVCAVEQGAAFAAIDFGPNKESIRFDIVLLNENGRYFVALVKRISPAWDFEKIEFSGAGDVDHPHTYQLRYDRTTKKASLWIDDELKLSGYQGQRQFLEDRGLFLGSFSTGYSKIGTGIFRLVKFEAD